MNRLFDPYIEIHTSSSGCFANTLEMSTGSCSL